MILIIVLLALSVLAYLLVDKRLRDTYWAYSLGIFSFIFLVTLNLQWPDFAPMGERLRDYAILSAVMHDPIAPQEPWFVGFPLNYYLNWYRIAALPGFLGAAPWEIYHLLGPATMSVGISATALLLVYWASVTPLLASWIAITVWCGSNVAGAIAVLHRDHNWWGPSRVIKGAINEFPAWSWMLGDLHPHYLNLCALPVMLVLSRHIRGWTFLLALIALCAWNYSANAWDTAPGLVLLAVLVVLDWRSLFSRERAWKTAMMLVLITLLCVYSALHIDAPHAPIRLVDFSGAFQDYVDALAAFSPVEISPHTTGVAGSNLGEFALHWGVPLALLALGILMRMSTVLDAVAIGLVCIAVFLTKSVLVLLITSGLLVAYFLRWKFTRPQALLVATLVILAIPEVIFFDDPYGGENERMNTIFKFYSFVWVPFFIGSWCWVIDTLKPRYATVLACVAAIVMLPWTAQTVGDRRQRDFIIAPKAEGLSYFERTYPGSGKAIQKFLKLPRGTVVEAENGAYSDGSFIGTLASQPSYLGWANHVGLLLKNPPELGRRQQVIKELYEASCEQKRVIMKREKITYLVFGPIEVRMFPGLSRSAFSCLNAVIDEQAVVIFQP